MNFTPEENVKIDELKVNMDTFVQSLCSIDSACQSIMTNIDNVDTILQTNNMLDIDTSVYCNFDFDITRMRNIIDALMDDMEDLAVELEEKVPGFFDED